MLDELKVSKLFRFSDGQPIQGARQIMDQIKSNTVARILEEEKKNAESGTPG